MSQVPGSMDVNTAVRVADDLSARGHNAQAVEHYRWSAAMLWQQGQIHHALGIYSKVADLLPQCLHTRAMIAEAHRQLGDSERAAYLYEEIAQIHACGARWAEAIAVYELIVSFGPQQAWRRARYADLLAHLGRNETACQQLERAAQELHSAHDLDGFVQVMERRLQLGPDDRNIRGSLVRTCLELDRLPAAARHLQAMLNADPRDPAAKLLYAELYARRGQPELAADTVCAVVRKLIRKKEHARADALLRRALEWVPNHPLALRLQDDLDDGRDVTEIADGQGPLPAFYPRPRAMTMHAADDIVSGQFIA